MDFYPTPMEAVRPLLPWLPSNATFCEPCAGQGDLIRHLEVSGHRCTSAFDADPASAYPVLDGRNLNTDLLGGADFIITNPPWTRDILHDLIMRFSDIAPTWLLFDADWMFTKQAAPYIKRCTAIIAVGRVKWIPGSKNTGKDNCAWYRFEQQHVMTRPYFVGRE
jgi:hypothetical protein